MKSKEMEKHFQTLISQRERFYQEIAPDLKYVWERPLPGKWSVGETLYHLYLMVKLFRRVSNVYIPILLPYAYVRRKKPYATSTYNIYEAYTEKKKRSMSAPSVIVPPSGLEKKYNITEVQWFLEYQTELLKKRLQNIPQDVAGQIHYPDPIAHYPNIIQSIHLLAIHEKHHFDITLNYYA